MKKKLRHSKFKNTGILFELLIRQITADIVSGKEGESDAKNLLFKYFKENAELGKEYRLYKFLLNEKIKDSQKAERFLSIIIEQRKKLNSRKLLEQKYALIKEIKNKYSIEELLKTNIKNYKALASIYKLFEDAASKNEIKFDVNEIFQAKTCIVENITDKKILRTNDADDIIKLYEQQDLEVRLLSYKLLVEGLNKKYSNLDDNQKEVLREYINNIANTNSLGVFMNSKINDVKQQLVEISSKIKDADSDVIKIKINEVTKQLDKVKPGKVVKDNQVMVLLLSYELLKEVKSRTEKLTENEKIAS
jgi:hypothetical protein